MSQSPASSVSFTPTRSDISLNSYNELDESAVTARFIADILDTRDSLSPMESMHLDKSVPHDIELPSVNGVPNPLGAIGSEYARARKNKRQKINNTDNVSGYPNTAYGVSLTCDRCKQRSPIMRCNQCKDLLCSNCCYNPTFICQVKKHALQPIDTTFIGVTSNSDRDKEYRFCDVHGDHLKFLCEECRVFICDVCIMWNHKDHEYFPINTAFDIRTRLDMMDLMKDTKINSTEINAEIDRAIVSSKTYTKESADVKNKVRTTMQCLTKAVEDHGRNLLDKVKKMHQARINELSTHTNTLHDMLEYLSRTKDTLAQSVNSQGIQLFIAKENGRAQVDHISSKFEKINFTTERMGFIPPDKDLIEKLKQEGDVQSISPNSNLILSYRLNHRRQSCTCNICRQHSCSQYVNHNVASNSSTRPQLTRPCYYSNIRPANFNHPTHYHQSSILASVPHYISHCTSSVVKGCCHQPFSFPTA